MARKTANSARNLALVFVITCAAASRAALQRGSVRLIGGEESVCEGRALVYTGQQWGSLPLRKCEVAGLSATCFCTYFPIASQRA